LRARDFGAAFNTHCVGGFHDKNILEAAHFEPMQNLGGDKIGGDFKRLEEFPLLDCRDFTRVSQVRFVWL